MLVLSSASDFLLNKVHRLSNITLINRIHSLEMSEQTLIKVDSLRPDTSGHDLLVKVPGMHVQCDDYRNSDVQPQNKTPLSLSSTTRCASHPTHPPSSSSSSSPGHRGQNSPQ